ncbi:iron ABC transporter permease [Burkholderiaceae bacterium FT117]|nr:iron ABC transporter permease [Zeimonas sediminis]MCM5569343.1 iron ABC transporter permease [Zeimonas sediminis]
MLLALAVAAPIVALAWLAFAPGAADAGALGHLLGTVLPRYTVATAHLAIVVVAIVLLLGVSTGWLVAAYEFPGRGLLAWLLVLPLSTPAFVMAYAYTDFLATWGPLQAWIRALTGLEVGEYWFPEIHSPNGAGLFLGLALYPYVYLLARAAFADRSPSLSEAARSLGMNRTAVWWRVTWPVARPAVAAGTALALMETLADFGTVSYFAVDSFTAGIYRAWQGMGDRVGAARLALMLLAFVGALMWIERRSRSRMRFHARAARPAPRVPLQGWRAWRATLWCALPPLLGFLLPALLLLRGWLADGAGIDPRLGDWILNTALLAAAGAATVLPLALFAAYAARLGGGRALHAGITLANSGYAVPGVVLGVGLLILSGQVDRILAGLGMPAVLAGGSVLAVVYAYSVRFFSVGWQGIDASLKRISPSMDQSARSLGRRPVEVLREVHWPLMRRGLASAALLVFIDCLKELPATLVLRPFDFDTLAVVAYQFASDERLAAAALPSLLIVAVGLAPVIFLSRVASSETKH